MPSGSRINRLIGVYDADAGVLGELRYAWGRATGGQHCALCDLTHRGLRAAPGWRRFSARLGVPFVLVHRNQRSPHVLAATGGELPCVVAEVGDQMVVLLGSDELSACDGSIDELELRLRRAVADRQLVLPAPS